MLGVELEEKKCLIPAVASPQWRDQPFLGNLQPEEPARSALHPSLSYIWSTTILDSIWWTMSEEYTALHQRTVLDYIWWTTLDYIWWTSLEDYTVYWTTFGGLHWTSSKCITDILLAMLCNWGGWIVHCSEMSGHYWTVSHGLRTSVGSGRGAREGIRWRKRGPGALLLHSLVKSPLRWNLNLEFGGGKATLVLWCDILWWKTPSF